ncbi:MAG TPA: hypothetical protein VHS99_09670 [Chloroflexota bacterium]|nr:hypothetical protein [Chloroflexota bacterium]
MPVHALLLAIAILTAAGSLGVTALRRLRAPLTPLEQVAYGVPLGVVVASLATLPLAWAFGLSAVLVGATGLLCGAGAFLLWPAWPRRSARPAAAGGRAGGLLASAAGAVRVRSAPLAALVVGAFAVRWAVLWSGALTYDAQGLWAGHVNLWGDWSLHLGDTASFAYGGNLPPQQPRLVGHAFAYHYLAAFTGAMLVTLGLDAAAALSLHSFVFSVLIALGLLAFGRRLTGDTGVAALALVLFLLGGGLGWLVTVAAAAGSTEGLRALLQHPWDEQAQRAANFQWKDVYFNLIMPQRAYLYGLPLALLVLTLLFAAVQQQGRTHYLVAGVVAGLLPLAHLGTLLALALLTPALALLFPSRRWVLFFAAWVVIAAPQLGLLLGSEHQAGAVRLQVGWMAGDDAWPWFWLKNLGFFLPLLGLALVRRRGMPVPGYRFLWAFMPVFVAGNLVVFQPWAWDNTKIFVYWFLGVCILVAALLAHAWRAHPVHPEQDVMHSVRAAAVHGLVAGAVLVMTLPGLLANLDQLLGKDRHLLLTAEELRVAAAVREQTPRRSVFAVGLQHNHPVTVMTGRPVVMGYPGWLWTHGYDYTERERDLRTIYAFGPNAPELLKKYGVSFLVMGPTERQQLGGDSAAYRQHYRTIVRSANYEVFAVGEERP